MSPDTVPVFYLGGGRSDPDEASRALVGTKAHNLMRLDRIGLPVPPALAIGTDLCRLYHARDRRLPPNFANRLGAWMRGLEKLCGRRLGSPRKPLLVSVRSGSPASMPGMMDTLLNVGLNESTIRGLIRTTGNPRLAWDCYRRLVRDYGELVHGCPPAPFEEAERRLCVDGAGNEREPDFQDLRSLARTHAELVESHADRPFPHDPLEQLVRAVEVVLDSWHGERATEYRRVNDLDDGLGTAVVIQMMVFGNAGGMSGSGVGFTRDPSTGARGLYVDFLYDAQGEDVVSGHALGQDADLLRERQPQVFAELERVACELEAEFRDMQDFEFTVEEGRLHLLQTRSGKRTPWAALQIAVDMEAEGLITPTAALERLRNVELASIERTTLAGSANTPPVAAAVPAGMGIAAGALAFDPERAVAMAATQPVILVRESPSTDDFGAMAAVDGVLTRTGSRTSHAAVVARQLGKVCLVGCRDLRVEADRQRCFIGDIVLEEGAHVTLDGESGAVYPAHLEIAHERPVAALARVARWREIP